MDKKKLTISFPDLEEDEDFGGGLTGKYERAYYALASGNTKKFGKICKEIADLSDHTNGVALFRTFAEMCDPENNSFNDLIFDLKIHPKSEVSFDNSAATSIANYFDNILPVGKLMESFGMDKWGHQELAIWETQKNLALKYGLSEQTILKADNYEELKNSLSEIGIDNSGISTRTLKEVWGSFKILRDQINEFGDIYEQINEDTELCNKE